MSWPATWRRCRIGASTGSRPRPFRTCYATSGSSAEEAGCDFVETNLEATVGGSHVRRARPGVRVLRGRLHSRHLRQPQWAGGRDLCRPRRQNDHGPARPPDPQLSDQTGTKGCRMELAQPDATFPDAFHGEWLAGWNEAALGQGRYRLPNADGASSVAAAVSRFAASSVAVAYKLDGRQVRRERRRTP